MSIEIHWPIKGTNVDTVDFTTTSITHHSVLLRDLIILSYKYDIIIDCGKVTFVEKE